MVAKEQKPVFGSRAEEAYFSVQLELRDPFLLRARKQMGRGQTVENGAGKAHFT